MASTREILQISPQMRLEPGFWCAWQLLLFLLTMKLLLLLEVLPGTPAASWCMSLLPAELAAAACPLLQCEPWFHSHVGEALAACQPFVFSLRCSLFAKKRRKCSWLVVETLCWCVSLYRASSLKGECSVNYLPLNSSLTPEGWCQTLFRLIWLLKIVPVIFSYKRVGGQRRQTEHPVP